MLRDQIFTECRCRIVIALAAVLDDVVVWRQVVVERAQVRLDEDEFVDNPGREGVPQF